MSDFFKKAAGLIFNVQNDEDDTRERTNERNSDHRQAVPAVNAAATASPADQAAFEKFKSYFKALYEKANLPGPDFYEFNNMTEAMGNMIPDEVKYPSVFAGFGGALTKDKLLSSAAHYLDMIQKDAAAFEQSWQAAVKNKIEDRRSLILQKTETIRQLQEQIAELNSGIAELHKTAQAEEIRLASEKNAYQQQAALLQQQINSGVAKINRFIG